MRCTIVIRFDCFVQLFTPLLYVPFDKVAQKQWEHIRTITVHRMVSDLWGTLNKGEWVFWQCIEIFLKTQICKDFLLFYSSLIFIIFMESQFWLLLCRLLQSGCKSSALHFCSELFARPRLLSPPDKSKDFLLQQTGERSPPIWIKHLPF